VAVVTYDAPSASRSCMTVESDMGSRDAVLDTTEDEEDAWLLLLDDSNSKRRRRDKEEE
jgi:hypothetical protein